MRANELFNMSKAISELEKSKEVPYEVQCLLIDLYEIINDEVRIISKKVKKLQTTIQDLSIQYCKKDNEGKPVIRKTDNGEIYEGLSRGLNPEFDKEVENLSLKMESLDEEILKLDFTNVKKVPRAFIKNISIWDGYYERIFHRFIE